MIEVQLKPIGSDITINGIGYSTNPEVTAYMGLHGDREFSMFEADIQADIVINGTPSNKTGITLHRSNPDVEAFLTWIKTKLD